MAKAIILTVDDDMTVSQAITRDLRSRYGDRYRIIRATSGAEALESLEEFARRDLDVALIVSDHRMPGMTGIELLEPRSRSPPGTKRVLLTAYADTDVAIRAINEIGLDHYLLKPWSPPDERLYPVLDDLLAEWEPANEPRFDGVRVVGDRWSDRSYDARMFLARNHVHYQWLELERDPEAQRLHALFEATADDAPAGALARRHRAARRGQRRARRRGRPANAAPSRRCTTSSSSAAARPGSAPRSTAPPRVCASAIIERRRARWAGRPERPDRELPRVPERAERLGPVAPRHDARRRRLGAEMVLARTVDRTRAARLHPRRPLRRRHRGRGASRPRRDRCLVPAAGRRRTGRVHRSGRLLRRRRERRPIAPRATTSTSSAAANSAGQAALHIAQYARRVVMLVRESRSTRRCRATWSATCAGDATTSTSGSRPRWFAAVAPTTSSG